MEIHGQHDQQRLLDEDWQRDLLDAFGGHGEAAGARSPRPWSAGGRTGRALADLAMDPRELLRRLELLEHEAAEIDGARLRPGEADEITRQLAAAQHGETIARGAATVRDTLLGEGGGARERVALAEHELRALARLDDRWSTARGSPGRARGRARGRRRRGPGAGRDRGPRPGVARAPRGRASARSTGCCAATATTRRR